MNRWIREEQGCYAAKGGFAHEKRIKDEFNKWQQSPMAQVWLQTMGFDLNAIQQVNAERPTEHAKTDVQITILLKDGTTHICNISCKKGGGNQIDKRWVDQYADEFNFSETARNGLKKFTGEPGFTPPELLAKGAISQSKYQALKDKRRFTFPELEPYEQEAILADFSRCRDTIIQFLLQGSGDNAPQWFMKGYELIPMAKAIRLARGGGQVVPTRTGFRIGQIKAQRKGGTPDPTKLQFKWDGI